MPAPFVDIVDTELQTDHSINVVAAAEEVLGDNFISAVINYGYRSGSYTKHIDLTGPQEDLEGAIPAQTAGGTVYMICTATYVSGSYTSTEAMVVVPASIPGEYTNPTGKNNALSSFNLWLTRVVALRVSGDFGWIFDPEMQPATYPHVEVTEFQYFNPGNTAFGMEVFPANSYPAAAPPTQGTQMEMLIQINIRADQGADVNAKKTVYQIRDRIKRALQLSAMVDSSTGNGYVEPIQVLDYDANTDGLATGILARIPVEKDNAIQERYLPPDAGAQNIHTIQLLVQLQWFEMN